MARLPQINGDDGVWGQILNDYLSVSHNADGTEKATGSTLPPGGSTGQVLTKESSVDGAADWEDASGGGSQPGIGDWCTADTDNAPTIPNTGDYTVVPFDDGVQGGGAGDVTLSEDGTTFTVAVAAQVTISYYLIFDATDPTGIRGGQIQTLGSSDLDDAQPYSPTSPGGGIGGIALVAQSWTGKMSAGGTIQIEAAVDGAAGDVALQYAEATVTIVAPVGS